MMDTMKKWSLLLALAVSLGSAGPAAAQGAAQGGAGASAMVLDAQNNSLVIRTSPRNHRRIADLIRKVAEGKIEGEQIETRIFNVMNMSPDQLFQIVEFQQPTFERSNTLVLEETANGQALRGP